MIKHFKTLLRGEVDALSLRSRDAGLPPIAWRLPSAVATARPSGFGEHRCNGFHCDQVSVVNFSDLHRQRAVNGMLAHFWSGLSGKPRCNFDAFFAIAAKVILGAQPSHAVRSLHAAADGKRDPQHSMMLLTHVFAIAFSGIMANRRLLNVLRRMTGDTTARAVLCSWLGNHFFSGRCGNLRPFIAHPV